MSNAFSRTLRSLEADRSRRGPLFVSIALLFFGAWTVWLTRARVPVFAASREARLVVEHAVHTLEAPVSGRLESVFAALDQPVEAGAILFQIDDRASRLARAEELARVAASSRRIESTQAVLAMRQRALEEAHAAALAGVQEARLVRHTRELELRYAEEELQRLEQLRDSSVSQLQVSKARTEVETRGVAIETQDASITRLELEQRRAETDLAAEIEGLKRDITGAEGDLAVARAAVERLELEIERCRVRAPAAGVVGDLAPLATGAFVAAGARLATVVGPGRVAVEASFTPADALGRIREGQTADLALDGFPRIEYGALELTVARVASEARSGTIQVELSITDSARNPIPLEHGLPGRVRVEVERASPAAIVLRAVGRSLGGTLASHESRDG